MCPPLKRRGGARTEAIKSLPERLVIELTAHRTLALRDAVTNNPRIAITALFHRLVLDCFGSRIIWAEYSLLSLTGKPLWPKAHYPMGQRAEDQTVPTSEHLTPAIVEVGLDTVPPVLDADVLIGEPNIVEIGPAVTIPAVADQRDQGALPLLAHQDGCHVQNADEFGPGGAANAPEQPLGQHTCRAASPGWKPCSFSPSSEE